MSEEEADWVATPKWSEVGNGSEERWSDAAWLTRLETIYGRVSVASRDVGCWSSLDGKEVRKESKVSRPPAPESTPGLPER